MRTRRIVGIDLGIASTHTVVVIDETTEVVARRRCRPELESLVKIEAAALAGAPDGTRLESSSSRRGRPGCRWRCSSAGGAIGCTG